MGLVDAQIAEVVETIDILLGAAPAADSGGDVNGVFGPLVEVAAPGDENFGGQAGGGWRDAHRDVSAGGARIARADEVFASSVAAARQRSVEVRSRLTAMRAELLELSSAARCVGASVGIDRELLEGVLARAREFHAICVDNAQFSSELSRSMAAAVQLYQH